MVFETVVLCWLLGCVLDRPRGLRLGDSAAGNPASPASSSSSSSSLQQQDGQVSPAAPGEWYAGGEDGEAAVLNQDESNAPSC